MDGTQHTNRVGDGACYCASASDQRRSDRAHGLQGDLGLLAGDEAGDASGGGRNTGPETTPHSYRRHMTLLARFGGGVHLLLGVLLGLDDPLRDQAP